MKVNTARSAPGNSIEETATKGSPQGSLQRLSVLVNENVKGQSRSASRGHSEITRLTAI